MHKKIIIISIFLLAFFLRVYKLGSYPAGFLWDEASLGYNAYSILKTGRDEYGQLLPLIFKSFGDYKPGFYVYLTIPSVLIFGLTEFAVRLPSAITGVATVILMYFLIKESQGFSLIDRRIYTDSVAQVSALLLAISPWHIMFSRGSWELNVMLFEFLLGFYFVTKYFNYKKKSWLFWSIIPFSLTLITYQSAKFLLPVLLAGFAFFFKNEISKKEKKTAFSFSAILVIIFIVFNLLTILGGKGGRVKAMSLFSYPRSSEEKEVFLSQDKNINIYNFFHGTSIFFTRSVLGRYFHHFSGKFLFITGDWSNQRNGVSYQGVMYYFDLIFLLIGLAVLFAKKRLPFDNFILFWLIMAPLPSALTRDSISSVRSFTMVIPLIYITAIGVIKVFGVLQGLSLPKQGKTLSVLQGFFRRFFVPIILYSLFIIQLFLLIRFLDLYYVHDPKYSSENRLYGYKDVVNYIAPIVSQKNKVVFTDSYGQPYIFYLFYSKYNPQSYQRQAILKENLFGDVGNVEKIDNIEFREIYWPNDRAFSNSLFIGDEFDLPITDVVGQNNITLLKEIKLLNNKTAFRIVETN